MLTLGLYPVFVPVPLRRKHKLPAGVWVELAKQRKTKSLRTLAKEYGVSHEAIRQTIANATKAML